MQINGKYKMSQSPKLNIPFSPFYKPKCRVLLVSSLLAIIFVTMFCLNLAVSGEYSLQEIRSIDISHQEVYSQDLYGVLERIKNDTRRYFDLEVREKLIPRFDLTREDSLLVFVHIQKTGGTAFGKHLLKDLKRFSCPCMVINKHKQRHCECYHPGTHQLWYFSRYTRGWVCGVHPDYTTLKHCLPQLFNSSTNREGRKLTPHYLYITFIRDPIQRYLSEFRHTSLGAKWPVRESHCKNNKLQFNSKKLNKQIVSPCLPLGASDWAGVSLAEFMECKLNPAANRMTRMLADLTDIRCNPDFIDSKEKVEKNMLTSAKSNLREFAYFGLTEYQRGSQTLFERTFGVEFSKGFEQQQTHAHTMQVSSDTEQRIREINHLDVELYKWAKELFLSRVGG